MTVSNATLAKSIYLNTLALGDKSVSSDAWMEIEGAENLSVLIKQFPMPILSSAGEIEVPMPLGILGYQPQQVKFNQQGGVAFMETKSGTISKFMERLHSVQGGIFNAVVYEGTPQEFSRKCRIFRCFVQLDNPDRDFENRAQLTIVSGTMFYNFFGDEE